MSVTWHLALALLPSKDIVTKSIKIFARRRGEEKKKKIAPRVRAPKGKLMAARAREGFMGLILWQKAISLPFSFTWQDSFGGTLGTLKRTLFIYTIITLISISFMCSFLIKHECEQIYKYITWAPTLLQASVLYACLSIAEKQVKTDYFSKRPKGVAMLFVIIDETYIDNVSRRTFNPIRHAKPN